MKQGNKIIAIIRDIAVEDIVNITKTLLDVGIDTLEVSLSNEKLGLQCIEKINDVFADKINLGVGTVITREQVDKALQAGAKYMITPGWDLNVVEYILSKDIPIYPGVFTPGEIGQAARLGIDTVKVFPAINLGPSYIKNLHGPFPNMNYMAVGGVSKDNIIEFREAGCTSFAIGSDLVPRKATKSDLDKIKENATDFQELIFGEIL